MEKIIKFFPFLPAPKDTGKFILALLFYAVGVPCACTIVSVVLFFTIIIPGLLGTLGLIYSIAGIVFSILAFIGHDCMTAKAEAVEEVAEPVEAAVEE